MVHGMSLFLRSLLAEIVALLALSLGAVVAVFSCGVYPVAANMAEVGADLLEDTGVLVVLALFVVEAARQR